MPTPPGCRHCRLLALGKPAGVTPAFFKVALNAIGEGCALVVKKDQGLCPWDPAWVESPPRAPLLT
jgi:hypothetical protein